MEHDKSPGSDELTADIIKLIDGGGLEDILDVLNSWWQDRKMPEEAKITKVVPLYKKGSPDKQ